MRPKFAILLLLIPAGLTALRAQPAADPGKQSVLILLRQPEGALGKRLAEAPSSATVPEEVRTAALREQTSLTREQKESFERRLLASGASGVVHYPALNMMRADIPRSAISSLHSDPAVVSVTPLSEEAPPLVSGEPVASPPANLAAAVPAMGGVTAGRLGRKSETFQPPSFLTNAISGGTPAGQGTPVAAFMPPVQMPGMMAPVPGANLPGGALPGMQGNMLPGTMTPGYANGGGMFQSILGVTGQMGMQAGTVMPRAAGMVSLLTGGAQIAQIIVSSRKQGCAILTSTVGTQIPEAGGPGVIAVNAPPSCLWHAQSDSDWLQIAEGGPMLGPGIVRYNAGPASTGMLRTGVIRIEGIAGARVRGKTSTTIRQGQ